MDSVVFSLAFLVFAAGICVPLILAGKWNIELVKRNREARLHNDLEFVRRLRNVRIVEVVVDLVQLALLAIAIVARSHVNEWIGIGIVWVIAIVARLRVNRAKKQLLAEGPKTIS
jgi:hypothetical protein